MFFFCPREEDGKVTFSASSVGGEQLTRALAALRVAAGAAGGAAGARDSAPEPEDDSDDEPPMPPPPIVISEADFREKGMLFTVLFLFSIKVYIYSLKIQ